MADGNVLFPLLNVHIRLFIIYFFYFPKKSLQRVQLIQRTVELLLRLFVAWDFGQVLLMLFEISI